MPATLFRKFTRYLDENEFIQVLIWEVDPAVLGSDHGYKYSMAYIVSGVCVMRYDNERGKGDHKHIGDQEINTSFASIDQLFADFLADVETIRNERG